MCLKFCPVIGQSLVGKTNLFSTTAGGQKATKIFLRPFVRYVCKAFLTF